MASRHGKEWVIYLVVRSYSGPGTSELFDLMGERSDEVRELITGVPGFVSYAAARTGGDSGVTATLCQDEAGTDESSRRAAAWVSENVSVPGVVPAISEGTTVVQF